MSDAAMAKAEETVAAFNVPLTEQDVLENGYGYVVLVAQALDEFAAEQVALWRAASEQWERAACQEMQGAKRTDDRLAALRALVRRMRAGMVMQHSCATVRLDGTCQGCRIGDLLTESWRFLEKGILADPDPS